MTLGGFLGFATGYAFKIFGKGLLLVFGVEALFLQYMAWKGFISIDWGLIANRSSESFGYHFWWRVLTFLTFNIPCSSTFIPSLYVGATYNFE